MSCRDLEVEAQTILASSSCLSSMPLKETGRLDRQSLRTSVRIPSPLFHCRIYITLRENAETFFFFSFRTSSRNAQGEVPSNISQRMHLRVPFCPLHVQTNIFNHKRKATPSEGYTEESCFRPQTNQTFHPNIFVLKNCVYDRHLVCYHEWLGPIFTNLSCLRRVL